MDFHVVERENGQASFGIWTDFPVPLSHSVKDSIVESLEDCSERRQISESNLATSHGHGRVELVHISPGSNRLMTSTWKVKESQSLACAHRQRKKQPELSFRLFEDGKEGMR